MRFKLLFALLTVGAIALFATAFALASHADSKAGGATAAVRVSTRSVSGLGRILVDSHGRTLYMFVPDKRKSVTCVKICAKIWPPLKLPAGAKAVAAGGVKATLLGSDRDPAGGRVVTYNGWPLYTYIADRKAGAASGQARNLNGGLWYVLSSSGKVIKAKAHAASKSSKCGNDSDFDGDQGGAAPDDGDGCM